MAAPAYPVFYTQQALLHGVQAHIVKTHIITLFLGLGGGYLCSAPGESCFLGKTDILLETDFYTLQSDLPALYGAAAILGGYFLRIHSISVMEGQKNPLLILRLLYGSSLGGYPSISSEILTK